jgi:16S rRNA (guanine966-N2)-methyltransferase
LEARGYLEDAVVLDLFAGTGALGLEALSRGASSATLIEKDRQAAVVIRANLNTAKRALAAAGIAAEIDLMEGGVKAKLSQLQAQNRSFDLIFADPPYEFSDEQLTDELNVVAELLREDGLLIIERDKRGFAGSLPGLKFSWEKAYGDTRVLAFERESADQSA